MSIERARADLARKLREEVSFRNKILRGFATEVSIFKREIVRKGSLVEPEKLRALWFELVNSQYQKVAPLFATPDGLTQEQVGELSYKLQAFARERAVKDSALIFKTSEKNMLLARHEAALLLKNDGVRVTNTALDRVGGRILRRLQAPRVGNITVTETQAAAEGAKKEKSVVQKKTRKEWFTVADGNVRPAHVAANHQVKYGKDPFVVGGQLLAYPGDVSLGATVSNVAYCRCASIYG